MTQATFSPPISSVPGITKRADARRGLSTDLFITSKICSEREREKGRGRRKTWTI